MATYRLSMSVAKRSEGRNAVAMAAYRSGQELYAERTGETLDFTRRRGILHSEVVLPAGAPEWAADRETLWNRSEAAHRRGHAVVAREIQLSLPHELTPDQRRELTLGFAAAIAEKYGIAVDTSLHAPSREGDERNHHAHLLLCTRPFDVGSKTGFGNNLRELDSIAHQRAGTENPVETLRQEWCDRLNTALERAGVRTAEGVTVQLDHRSYERRGLDQEPTVKLGPAASAMERRGEASDRGDENRAVAARNAEREQLRAELGGLERSQRELLDVPPNSAPDHPRQAHQLLQAQVEQALDPAPPAAPVPRRAERLTTAEYQQHALEPAEKGARAMEQDPKQQFEELIGAIRRGEVSPAQLSEHLAAARKAHAALSEQQREAAPNRSTPAQPERSGPSEREPEL